MREKKIHYCWFGNSPKSELIESCIASWKRFAPDYEIIEWNESNFDVHCSRYVNEAYEARRWAFVSDYCRFWVLHTYGGIYLDTDVELIKPIDDLPDNFVGFETPERVASGLIRGAEKADMVCKMVLDSFNNDVFIKEDGTENIETICMRETNILCEHGLSLNGTLQCVLGTTVFPTEYFCPLNFTGGKLEITEKTYSIHHYESSWYNERERFANTLGKQLSRRLPEGVAFKSANAISIIKFDGIKGLVAHVIKKIKNR